MARADIRMQPGEVRHLLGAHRFAVLASIDEQGDVVAALVPCRLDEATDRVVVRAEETGGPVCVLVEEQSSYDAIRGVAVHGVPVAAAGELCLGLDDVVSFDFGHTSGRPEA